MPLERECEEALQWQKDMVKADLQLAEKLNFLHQQRQKSQEEGRKQPDFKISASVGCCGRLVVEAGYIRSG